MLQLYNKYHNHTYENFNMKMSGSARHNVCIDAAEP